MILCNRSSSICFLGVSIEHEGSQFAPVVQPVTPTVPVEGKRGGLNPGEQTLTFLFLSFTSVRPSRKQRDKSYAPPWTGACTSLDASHSTFCCCLTVIHKARECQDWAKTPMKVGELSSSCLRESWTTAVSPRFCCAGIKKTITVLL